MIWDRLGSLQITAAAEEGEAEQLVVLVSPVHSANGGNSPSREHFVPFALDRGEVGEVEGEHLREGKMKGDTSTTIRMTEK